MDPVAKLLGASDAMALVKYYAALPAIDAIGDAAASSAAVATGEALASGGVWA